MGHTTHVQVYAVCGRGEGSVLLDLGLTVLDAIKAIAAFYDYDLDAVSSYKLIHNAAVLDHGHFLYECLPPNAQVRLETEER